MLAVTPDTDLGGGRPATVRRTGGAAMNGSACWSRARSALIAALIVAGSFFAVATGFFAFAAPADAAEVCGAETFLTVEFTNNSDAPLTLKEVKGLEGEFCDAPAHTIGVNEKVLISSYNTVPFFGTEFTLVYELPNHSQVEVNYEVPEFGSNSSRANAPPEYSIHTAEPENFLFTTTFEGCKETVGDGICDQWKEHGVTIDPTTGKPVPPGTPGGQFIDLPAMGVSLDRPTVMVQMDWMENEEHNQKLRQSAIDKVIEAYSNDPFTYPGATRSGVTLVVDAGPESTITPGGEKWGSLSRAKPIPWKENFTTGKRSAPGINFTPYEELFKNSFVATGRKPIFHYDTVVADLSAESEGTSGWTPSGDGSIISLGDWEDGVGLCKIACRGGECLVIVQRAGRVVCPGPRSRSSRPVRRGRHSTTMECSPLLSTTSTLRLTELPAVSGSMLSVPSAASFSQDGTAGPPASGTR